MSHGRYNIEESISFEDCLRVSQVLRMYGCAIIPVLACENKGTMIGMDPIHSETLGRALIKREEKLSFSRLQELFKKPMLLNLTEEYISRERIKNEEREEFYELLFKKNKPRKLNKTNPNK